MEAVDKIVDRYRAVLKEDWRSDECRLSEAAGLAFAYAMITGKQISALKKPITLDDVDRMALETLTMEGEITVREDSPEVPSVGWPGSDATEGEITGRFEVPVGAVEVPVIAALVRQSRIHIDDYEDWVESYIRETTELWAKIELYGLIHIVPDKLGYDMRKYLPDIELTGITKKGDRAVIEFKVVLK